MSSTEGPIRVLHLLYSSLPEVTGYSVRSSYLLQSLRSLGVDAVAATVPDFGERAGTETIEGVPYHRWTPAAMGPSWRWVRRVPNYRNVYRLDREAEYYAGIAQRMGAQVIHSHSTARCGMLGGRVAARLGLSYLYEVRGLWDESAIAEGALVEGSLEHDRRRRLELRAVRSADRVVAISEVLKQHLVSNMGLQADRCVVVPNGVDVDRFRPWTGETPLRSDPRLGSGPVLGYIGSLRKMEGLDLAVRAMVRLRDRFPQARLAIVGDGPEREPLSRLAAELGVSEHVLVVGSIPHADVLVWYDRIDLFVVPRIDVPVTQLVTPLKPLEAMAAGRAILVSNVGGLRDLLGEPGRGYLFRAGDVEDLAAQATAALADDDGRRSTGERARRWVETERSWRKVAEAYLPVYRELIASPPRDTATRRRRLSPTSPPGRWVAACSLVVGAAILALSRTSGQWADPYVQGLLVSQVAIYLASHWLSRRAHEGELFRAAADTFFDVGFGVSLLGLAAWTERTAMPVQRLPLTLAAIGALCLLSGSQVGFYMLGKREHPTFWSTVRALLAVGVAVLSTVRLDFYPLLFVLLASTMAWTCHAMFVWRTSPVAPAPTPPTDPAARVAKPRDNIVDKIVFRPLSRRISLPLARAGASPNVITGVSIALGGFACWGMSHGDVPHSVLGGVVLQLAFLADCVDGEVARARGMASPFGAWFDRMADQCVLFLAILGLGLGSLTEHQTLLIWAAALALLACEIFPRTFRDKTSFVGALSRGKTTSARSGRMAPFHAWRERHGMGMSLGTGALVLVIGLGAILQFKFYTLLFVAVVRGFALLYKLMRIVRELE